MEDEVESRLRKLEAWMDAGHDAIGEMIRSRDRELAARSQAFDLILRVLLIRMASGGVVHANFVHRVRREVLAANATIKKSETKDVAAGAVFVEEEIERFFEFLQPTDRSSHTPAQEC